MRHLPRRHSRIFRALLGLALLAWTSLTWGAFAHPLVMSNGGSAKLAMRMGKAASLPCDGMASAETAHAAHPAPSHPAGGHGCCANGGCHCASSCNGIVGVPYLDGTMPSPNDPILPPVRAAPALIAAAPPLRPPIV